MLALLADVLMSTALELLVFPKKATKFRSSLTLATKVIVIHQAGECSLLNEGPLLSSGSLEVTQILVHKNGVIIAGSDKVEDTYKRVLYLYNRKTLINTALRSEDNCSLALLSGPNYSVGSGAELQRNSYCCGSSHSFHYSKRL